MDKSEDTHKWKTCMDKHKKALLAGLQAELGQEKIKD